MEHFRSQSCRDGRDMQIESYNNSAGGRQVVPTSMQDLRSYSTNHASNPGVSYKEVQIKKSKNSLGSTAKTWSFNDPELQRKKRVAGYKVYSVEGKVKGSFRKSFRWIKDIVYGWR